MIGPRLYVVVPCAPFEAVICDDLIGVDLKANMWMAEALCQNRVDARAIAKRMNAEAMKAWRRDRAKYARRVERERARSDAKAALRRAA